MFKRYAPTAALGVLVLALLLQLAPRPHYLAPDEIDVKALLPDPPATPNCPTKLH